MAGADLNRVTLVGRLTRDPDIRTTQGGQTIANMRLAVTSRENKGGEWGDKSNYFDVVAFGRTAETAQRFLTKGRRIGVDGRLSWSEWEKDGVKRQSVEINAGDIFFLDSSPNAGGGGQVRDDMAPDTRGLKTATDTEDVPF